MDTSTPSGSLVGGLASSYVPPKDWENITSDEKIERLREVIKNLSSSIARTQSDIHYLRESFKKHSHTDKEIVVPFNEYNNSNSLGIGENLVNPNYF